MAVKKGARRRPYSHRWQKWPDKLAQRHFPLQLRLSHSVLSPRLATEVALNVKLASSSLLSPTEPTSPVGPLARVGTEPPRDHRSRAPEFYGFVALASTCVLFVVYVLWALLPDEYIHWLGVKWYPNREWSLLLPAYSIVLVLLTYFVYFSLAIARAPSFRDVSTLVDAKGHLPRLVTPNPYLKHADTTIVPELYDIPIGIVNRVLYGPNTNVMHGRSR